MSPLAPLHRWQTVGALAAVALLCGWGAGPALALPVPRWPTHKPSWRLIPPQDVDRLPIADHGVLTRGGADDPAVIAALDDAARAIASDVDDTGRRVAGRRARKDEIKEAIKNCALAALRSAGESYRDPFVEALLAAEGAPSPGVAELRAAIASCLDTALSDVPVEDAYDIAQKLADARVAADDTSKTVPVDDPGPSRESGSYAKAGDDSSLWAAVIGFSVIGAIGATLYVRRRPRRG